MLEQPWFTSKDWPLHVGGDTPSYPFATKSESGIEYVIDRDRDHQRCPETDLPRDLICIMPKGHDTPHMPMTGSLARTIGPLIVHSMEARGMPFNDGCTDASREPR